MTYQGGRQKNNKLLIWVKIQPPGFQSLNLFDRATHFRCLLLTHTHVEFSEPDSDSPKISLEGRVRLQMVSPSIGMLPCGRIRFAKPKILGLPLAARYARVSQDWQHSLWVHSSLTRCVCCHDTGLVAFYGTCPLCEGLGRSAAEAKAFSCGLNHQFSLESCMLGESFWAVTFFFLEVDSPFLSAIVLSKNRSFSLGLWRFSRKKDPSKEWKWKVPLDSWGFTGEPLPPFAPKSRLGPPPGHRL